MLSFDARNASRQEMYRDLVYGTAELVSRDLPVAELLQRAVELGKEFFNASSLEIRLRDADLGDGSLRSDARISFDEAAALVLHTGIGIHAAGTTSMHVPIRFGSDVRGVISIASAPGATFDELDASLFEKWALLLAVRIHELHLCVANARLEVLAGIDGLTGIHNRRAFGELLTHAWQRAAQSGTSLAIAMIDVDFFKSYNDKYGHGGGDACLKQIAQTIGLSLRTGDVLGRYGGEEFAVFFEAASLDLAIEVSERLRENIFALGTPHLGSRLGRVTASIGVAAVVPRAHDDPTSLLERADAALYDAKASGRNRVVAESYVSESNIALPRHDVRNNLPTPASSFCARQEDAQRLRAALDQARLVTLAGFGGVGKTRLALEAANELIASFRDGVWFVDLAGTRDPEVIPALVAALLDVRDPAASIDGAALAERCRHKSLLLVLDNCEHLKRDCAAFATTLLRGALQVRILATSREPLDAADELVVLLAPFPLPEGGPLTAVEALRNPAIRLFVDRARAVTPFELRDENVPAVVDLCRRVDGIALGIELAAARLKMLSLEQLRGKLDRRFEMLGRKGSSTAARQQTLRALIDWSYELLSPAERTLLRRLGIFAGSFTFEAASAVCGDDDPDGDVLDALDALVDKSLLVVETRSQEQRTFRFFESIRSYARDRLAAIGEFDDIALRHRDYYLGVAATAHARRSTSEWLEALRPLEFAANDVRAVLESTLGCGRERAVGADLAAMLIDYWQVHGAAREARAWLECALRSTDAGFSADLLARVRLTLLDLLTMGEARAGLELATELAEAIRLGADPNLKAAVSFHLGHIHFSLGDLELARTYLEAARRESDACEDPLTLARASNLMGAVSTLSGDDANATAFFTGSEQMFHRLGRTARAVVPLGNLAEYACQRGRYDEAIDVAKRALAIAECCGDRSATAWLLANLGCYYLAAHDTDSAASFTLDALRIAVDLDDEWQSMGCCDTYARIVYERGEPDTAALLLGHADERLAELRLPRQPADHKRMDQLRAALRATLGLERTELRLAEGRGFSSAAMLALVDSGFTNLPSEHSLAS